MSVNLNGKMFGAIVAGVIAVGGAGSALYNSQKPGVPAVDARKPVYQPRIADQRSWGGLGGDEIAAINADLKNITASKVSIFCPGNFCRDLAEDFDEVFESAGFDAYLEQPVFDVGKGIGISPDNDRTRAIAAAISKETNGRIDLKVFTPLDQKANPVIAKNNEITIILARKAAN